MVPRAAFTQVTGRLRQHLTMPLITSNRINMAAVAEAVLARGDADLVSMARPMLADPDLALKARQGRETEINACIACNQACLDHSFSGRKQVSCPVNSRACNGTLLNYPPTASPKRIAVVGAGPDGLAYATVAAQHGHQITLFDSAAEIGGQFNLAKRIPGKEEPQHGGDCAGTAAAAQPARFSQLVLIDPVLLAPADYPLPATARLHAATGGRPQKPLRFGASDV